MSIVTILKVGGAFIALGSAIMGALAAYNKWQTWKKRRQISNDASADVFTRQFNKAEIDSALRGYLVPFCSPTDPTNKEGEDFLADTRESIFLYLDRNLALDSRSYHLLLADTGMGKTVFSLNYFARCKVKFKSLKTCLVSLASQEANSFIRSIVNKPNTILIADALDEDPNAIKRGRERLSEILELSADFKAVIITCRSQFFLSDDAIPRETPLPILIPRKLGQNPNFSLIRSYISPFGPDEVRRYINKNFPIYMFWKWSSRKRAIDLVRSVPDLAHRPMLLERLPEIAKDKARSSELYDLYDLLVDSWIARESRWIKKENLAAVSLELALYMYSRMDTNNGRHTPEEIAYVAESSLGKNPDWAHLTTRSLLNRDSRGNFKFAHKSILEFLVVFSACRGDGRALDYAWTPFMKEIFISWGHTDSGRGDWRMARKILSSEQGRENIAPLFDMLGIAAVRGMPDFRRCAERKFTSTGERIAPATWRPSAINIEYIDDSRVRIIDIEYNLRWIFILENPKDTIPLAKLGDVSSVLKNNEVLRLPSYEQFMCLIEGLHHSSAGFSLPEQTLYSLADIPSSRQKLVVQLNGDPVANDALRMVDKKRRISGTATYLTTFVTGLDISLNYQKEVTVSQLYLENDTALLF